MTGTRRVDSLTTCREAHSLISKLKQLRILFFHLAAPVFGTSAADPLHQK